jgi:hypothetical protein
MTIKKKEANALEIKQNYQWKYQINCNYFKVNGEVMDKIFNDLLIV